MWWFRLAKLWGCTVREAQYRCPSEEFVEWRAYHRIEPWGERRADLRAGIIAATFVNVMSKRGNAKASDFMPDFDKGKRKRRRLAPVKQQDPQEMLSVFRSFCMPLSK